MLTKNSSKAFTSLLSACALLGVCAAPASAASSSGAETYNYEFCETYVYTGDTYTVCSRAKGETNIVSTPSGNEKYQNNGTYEYSVSINGVFWYTSQDRTHYSVLFKKYEVQENHYRNTGTYTIDGQTCTYSYHYHFANGQTQFYNPDFSCVPA